MAKCWSYLLIFFVGIACGGSSQIALDDPGLLIRRSGTFAFVVSFDFLSMLEFWHLPLILEFVKY